MNTLPGGSLFLLDANGRLWFNRLRYESLVTEHPVGVNKMLDEWEQRLDDQYQKAKAAIQVLRATNLIDEKAIQGIPAGILPPAASEAELENACARIVNRSARGY